MKTTKTKKKVNTKPQHNLKEKPCNFCKEARELIEKKGSKIPEMRDFFGAMNPAGRKKGNVFIQPLSSCFAMKTIYSVT